MNIEINSSIFIMKTLSFINNISYKSPIKSLASQNYAVNPIVGADMGIPLNIIQNIFTTLHYGYDITTVKSVLLQILIGYYTYGGDRYKDALEYQEKPFETAKKELYEFFIKNKNLYRSTYKNTFIIIMLLLLVEEEMWYNVPFIFLLYTSEYYKDIKKINYYTKPLYISVMWTLSTVILPCVLHDHNYSILNYPIDYLPCLFTMFASSVILDIRDIEEDKINNIPTIPVTFGFTLTKKIILLLFIFSSFIFGINDNYLKNPIENSFFEMLNLGLSAYTFSIENPVNETLIK